MFCFDADWKTLASHIMNFAGKYLFLRGMIMAVRQLDLTIDRNTTFELQLDVRDQNNQPRNLSGYQAKMTIKRHYESPSATLVLSTPDNGITIGGDNNNMISISISATDTGKLIFLRGVYDLILINPSNNKVIRLLEGKVIVRPSVSVP